LSTPITAVGKVFIGDYAKSQQYVMELHDLLNQKSIPFITNKVMGVYYDNPQEKKPEDLKSFQGVFLNNPTQEVEPSLSKLSLKGNYLYTKVSGDPIKSIFDGYGALFKHIQENKVSLKSSTGYQVSTFENGAISTEIYMEII
jgi:DNA gyrase inhibitor GyrI